MSRATIILFLFIFVSCNNNLDRYEQIIQNTNRIEVSYRDSSEIQLTEQETKTFKNILTRNIEPEFLHKFRSDVSVDLYKDSNHIAVIKITNNSDKAFANFNSDSLNFGFQLTYGIGMFLSELSNK